MSHCTVLQSVCEDPLLHTEDECRFIYELCVCVCAYISKCLVTSQLLKPLHHMTILVSHQQRQRRERE